MSPDDAVEVRKIWAASVGGIAPLRAWVAGYAFVRLEGENAIVRHTEGLYEGLEARFPIADVRPFEILVDDEGRELRRPRIEEFSSVAEYVRAFHAWKDDVAKTANRAFDEAFAREMKR